jgi:hypothetical protein
MLAFSCAVANALQKPQSFSYKDIDCVKLTGRENMLV